jgi:hypothetical protein
MRDLAFFDPVNQDTFSWRGQEASSQARQQARLPRIPSTT